MLLRQSGALEPEELPEIAYADDGGAFRPVCGALPRSTVLTCRVTLLRRWGAAAIVLRLYEDGGGYTDYPLTFTDTDYLRDTYELTLRCDALCGERESALFYYEFLLVRGRDTLFTDTSNQKDFTLSPHSARLFRMLLHTDDFTVSAWLGGATMYHIFIDRFRRGAGKTVFREDSVLDTDWEHGVPQYGAYPGAEVSNTVFFGGNLWGVLEKLDELEQLGVTVLYCSPLFEARSNHKYDTGDYEKIDGGFGGEEAFDALLEGAHRRGMRVILDGVFNHTGDDSRYFNRYGRYDTVGAWQSPDSPYVPWYRFRQYPDDYDCWWGVRILPALQHAYPPCRRYFTAPDGIGARYIRRGIDGWRLDVTDELSDAFLDELRQSVKSASPDAVIIGEVWENAADKIAYGRRRRYFQGRQLDSVMNYPLRSGIIDFMTTGSAEQLYNTLTELYASYPRAAADSLMNLLGTHDTIRILTVLGGDPEGDLTNEQLSRKRMTPEQRQRGLHLLKLAAVLQFTVYGMPSVYYGDEAGMEGYRDPFCRMPYPWQAREESLLRHYRSLGALRKAHPCFAGGDFLDLRHGADWISYRRRKGADELLIAVSRAPKDVTLSCPGRWTPVLSSSPQNEKTREDTLLLPPDSFMIYQKTLPATAASAPNPSPAP